MPPQPNSPFPFSFCVLKVVLSLSQVRAEECVERLSYSWRLNGMAIKLSPCCYMLIFQRKWSQWTMLEMYKPWRPQSRTRCSSRWRDSTWCLTHCLCGLKLWGSEGPLYLSDRQTHKIQKNLNTELINEVMHFIGLKELFDILANVLICCDTTLMSLHVASQQPASLASHKDCKRK